MKKANLKTKVILWGVLTLLALAFIIISSILIYNSQIVLKISEVISLGDLSSSANATKAFAIGLLIFSIVIFLMGSYILYAGIKSWKYNAIL